MCFFFLYFVQSFTFLPKRQCVFFWALNIQLMFGCFIHVSAELAGHLPAWLLIHGSFCALLLPHALRLFSLTLGKAPAHNISFSVLGVIKMKATTEKITSLKHVVHTVQWLALDLSVQRQTSLHYRIMDINVTACPQQGLCWGLLKLNTQAGAGQPSSALGAGKALSSLDPVPRW